MTIHEDLVVMQTAVSNLELNKLIHVGFSVLALSTNFIMRKCFLITTT